MKTKTELMIKRDGIYAIAYVSHNWRVCSLDDLLDAALQEDADLAAAYAAILSDIASELYLEIRKEIDGSKDNGCCWYSIQLKHKANGKTLTTRKITRNEFKGWNPTSQQIKAVTRAILRRACEIGLGDAQYCV